MTVRVEREAYSLPVFDSAALHTVKFAAPASPNLEVFGLPDSVQQFGSLFRLAVPPIRDRQGFELCSSISRRCRFRFSRRTPIRARTRGAPYKLIRKVLASRFNLLRKIISFRFRVNEIRNSHLCKSVDGCAKFGEAKVFAA